MLTAMIYNINKWVNTILQTGVTKNVINKIGARTLVLIIITFINVTFMLQDVLKILNSHILYSILNQLKL